MTTLDTKEFTQSFSGLTSTAVTSVVFLGIGITLNETLKRLRRFEGKEDEKEHGMESWAMGYIYRARTWAIPSMPDYPGPVLGWVWQAMMRSEREIADGCGLDAATYIRWLRGLFFYTLTCSCTIFPILFSINIIYSPDSVALSSILRASVQSLVLSPRGSNLLWVHVLCLWLMTLGWITTMVWIGHGVLRNRRRVLRAYLAGQANFSNTYGPPLEGEKGIVHGVKDETYTRPEDGVPAPPEYPEATLAKEEDRGWRYRTLLMRNIPEGMRSAQAVADYYEWHFRQWDKAVAEGEEEVEKKAWSEAAPALTDKTKSLLGLGRKRVPLDYENNPVSEPSDALKEDGAQKRLVGYTPTPGGRIVSIIMVRKESELNDLYHKRWEAQYTLEGAHVGLAQAVLDFVGRKVRLEETLAARAARGNAAEPEPEQKSHWWSKKKEVDEDLEREAREGDAQLVEALRDYVPGLKGVKPPVDEHGAPISLWTALEALPPRLLDRFHPLHKLRHFHGQSVPSIDFHVRKLNLLSSLIEDRRAHLETYAPAASAFITFRSISDARMARKRLRTRPGGRPFECKVRVAPEKRDIDYTRLVLVSLSSDVLRGAILHTAVWAATIFWVFPLSFIVGLVSLDTLSKIVPALADYLSRHSAQRSIFSNLLPTSIIALIGMLVPTLIGILTRNGQAFVTVTKLHSAVQARYWKWLMINIVLIFCVGLSAFTAFLGAFRKPGSILPVIAAAFPKGGTFFVSWALLVVGVHHGIELAMLGIPYINHGSIRKLKSPRKREEEAQPRSFSVWYWVPNHLLTFGVFIIFAILNPLIVPFCCIYFGFSLTLFKNQFAHIYWARWYQHHGKLIYRRCFRYSLDCCLVAQVIAIAFLWVLKNYKLGGGCIPLIPITVFAKVIGTRWFDHLMARVDEQQADLVCGLPLEEDPDVESIDLEEPVDTQGFHMRDALHNLSDFATITLPALTLRPHERLPSTGSPPSKRARDRAYSTDSAAKAKAKVTATLRSPVSFETARPLTAPSPTEEKAREELTTPSRPSTLELLQARKKEASLGTVRPHPPIVRDDRPRSDLHYENPAEVAPLEHFLWLPRDPLLPVDLGDTIDWHGRALVSSEGGRGAIGTWEWNELDSEDEKDAVDDIKVIAYVDKVIEASPDAPTAAKAAIHQRLHGDERIRVADEIAARIEANEARESTLVPAPLRRQPSISSGSPSGLFRTRSSVLRAEGSPSGLFRSKTVMSSRTGALSPPTFEVTPSKVTVEPDEYPFPDPTSPPSPSPSPRLRPVELPLSQSPSHLSAEGIPAPQPSTSGGRVVSSPSVLSVSSATATDATRPARSPERRQGRRRASTRVVLPSSPEGRRASFVPNSAGWRRQSTVVPPTGSPMPGWAGSAMMPSKTHHTVSQSQAVRSELMEEYLAATAKRRELDRQRDKKEAKDLERAGAAADSEQKEGGSKITKLFWSKVTQGTGEEGADAQP